MADLTHVSEIGVTELTPVEIARADRQTELLRRYETADSLRQARESMGISQSLVANWKLDPAFAAGYKQAHKRWRKHKGLGDDGLVRFDPWREMRPTGTLVEWRRDVFGHPSTPTQTAFGEAYDDKSNLTIFWTAAAGAGKDVTTMQAVAKDSADGTEVMGCIMESKDQAKKRIDAYLDPYFTDPNLYDRIPDIPGGTMPIVNFIDEYGPWKFDGKLRLPDGSRPATVKWDAHNKWFVGRNTPQADPNLWALGLEAAIAGSRVKLLIASDLFTVENQRSATFRAEQYNLIDGTIDSRLDEGGRMIFINHHVRKRGESNLVKLMENHIGNARVIYKNGDYTKYANGVATIITPALKVNDEGIVVSYWPEKFPVRGQLLIGDEVHIADDLSDAEHADLSARGAKRVRGLEERQRKNPDLFELLYQQNPKGSGYGDFTIEILDACDDPDRTLGVSEPNELLVLSVDPARKGGAAWTLLGFNETTEVCTEIDHWIGDDLGFAGMRLKLIREPIQLYRPRDLVWEINFEGETLEHPEVIEITRKYHVNVIPWRTQYNRGLGEYQVMAMLDDMRVGKIRFPAQTSADKLKMADVKDHFQNFESVGYTERRKTVGSNRLPDDACLAWWMGWAHGKELLLNRKSHRERSTVRQAPAVNDAFGGYQL